MQNFNFKKFLIAMTAVFVANSACAADATVGVTATISPECAVTGGTSLIFTKLTMLNSATTGQSDLADVETGSIRAICTNGTANVKFTYTSENQDGSDFQLKGADDTMIKYSLHQDASATVGNMVSSGDLAGAAHPAFEANGEAQDLAISAKVQADDKRGKKVQAYSDTITVTTSFDA